MDLQVSGVTGAGLAPVDVRAPLADADAAHDHPVSLGGSNPPPPPPPGRPARPLTYERRALTPTQPTIIPSRSATPTRHRSPSRRLSAKKLGPRSMRRLIAATIGRAAARAIRPSLSETLASRMTKS